MMPHFCGNIWHDIAANFFVLMTFCPEWLPMGVAMKGWALNKLKMSN